MWSNAPAPWRWDATKPCSRHKAENVSAPFSLLSCPSSLLSFLLSAGADQPAARGGGGPNLEKIFSGESSSRRTANERGGGGVDKSTYICFGGSSVLGTFLRRVSRPVNIKAGGGDAGEEDHYLFFIFFGGGGGEATVLLHDFLFNSHFHLSQITQSFCCCFICSWEREREPPSLCNGSGFV